MTEDAWDLNHALSREFKVKSPPWLRPPPPPKPSTCLRGMPMGLKYYKNLTWQTNDQCNDSRRARLTKGTTLLQHPPPSRDWHGGPVSNPWRVSSGTEHDNKTNQESKPPMCFVTSVTRTLAIARFLCEYSGPFWGMFSKIRLDTRCSISKVCFLVISTFLKNTHDRNTYCSLLRDLRAQAQSARHVKREEREKELLISARVPTAKPTKAPPITPVLQAT